MKRDVVEPPYKDSSAFSGTTNDLKYQSTAGFDMLLSLADTDTVLWAGAALVFRLGSCAGFGCTSQRRQAHPVRSIPYGWPLFVGVLRV